MSFVRLAVWQKAMRLAEAAYHITSQFPRDERFGMTQQIRRAAVSVPSNIAEGSQRRSDKEYASFLLIAKGSLAELHMQLLLGCRLGFFSDVSLNSLLQQIQEIDKMLHAFSAKLISRSL